MIPPAHRAGRAEWVGLAMIALSHVSRPPRSSAPRRAVRMAALELQARLKQLRTERFVVSHTKLASNGAYVTDLEREITEVTAAYVGAAVTEIATLRAELFEPQVG